MTADESRTPDEAEIAMLAFERGHEGLFTSLLARVEKVDYERQTVDLQPVVRRRFIDGAGNVAHQRRPMINSVPVMFHAAGLCGFKFPIPIGATMLVVCLSHSADLWHLVGREVDAKDGRKHTLNDVVAFPAGYSIGGAARPQTKWISDAMVIASGTYDLRLVTDLANRTIAVLQEALAQQAKTNEIAVKLIGHVHETAMGPSSAAATPPAPAPPSILPPVNIAPLAAPTGSPRVKVP